MMTSVSKRQRGLAGLLLAGVLAGALTGCGVRQRRQDAAATATAQAESGLTSPTLAAATATPGDDQGDALERELEAISTQLSDSDTVDDLETALPPDEPTVTPTPAAEAATPEPAATTNEVTGSTSADEQGAALEALLDELQGQLDQTDTVGDAANP